MITETVCAESPVIRAISDLASGAVAAHEAQHQPLVLRAHAGLIRAALQRRRHGRRARPARVRLPSGIRISCAPSPGSGAATLAE